MYESTLFLSLVSDVSIVLCAVIYYLVYMYNTHKQKSNSVNSLAQLTKKKEKKTQLCTGGVGV